MSFQDNSGDIIFDVVLTDEGRKRLARGNFRITQFALGDDEINYELYDSGDTNNEDTEILQTPILEAFTNNMSSMNSKLVTYASADKLYLTVLKLSEVTTITQKHNSLRNFIVAVDGASEDNNEATTATTAIGIDSSGQVKGILFGRSVAKGVNHIRVDSGLDTNEIGSSDAYPGSDKETAFKIEIDHRLGMISDLEGNDASPVSVDGDNVATYILTTTGNPNFVKQNTSTASGTGSLQAIQGPRGPFVEFKIRSQLNLQQSNFLFTTLGTTGDLASYSDPSASGNIRQIDTIVRVTGMTTGYTLHIPVRFAKLI